MKTTRAIFASVPAGTAFMFLGNPIQFTKDTDFVARGYRAYNDGGSFIVSAIHREFSTGAIIDVIEKIDISK
jgi:hypothetical protein